MQSCAMAHLPKLGHFLIERRPDEVLAALRDFHAPSRFAGEPAVST
jgi:hypothetical protein